MTAFLETSRVTENGALLYGSSHGESVSAYNCSHGKTPRPLNMASCAHVCGERQRIVQGATVNNQWQASAVLGAGGCGHCGEWKQVWQKCGRFLMCE